MNLFLNNNGNYTEANKKTNHPKTFCKTRYVIKSLQKLSKSKIIYEMLNIARKL